MTSRFARAAAVAVVCAFAALVVSAPATAGTVKCKAITGLGSSLQNVAQEAWDAGFAAIHPGSLKATNECASFPTNKYVSASSGKGLEQWGSGGAKELGASKPAFIGDDVGAEKSGLEEMDKAGESSAKALNEVTVVPVAQSAISVDVTLPLGCSVTFDKKPRILASLLQAVWHGTALDNWLQLLSPGAPLFSGTNCNEEPIILGRASASGTSCGFKRLFANLKEEPKAEKEAWEKDTETVEKCLGTETWPVLPKEEGEIEGKLTKLEKGSQLVQSTFENPNMISYADLADAVATGKFATGLAVTQHTDKTGKVAGETLTSFVTEVTNSLYGTETSAASPELLTGAKKGASNCAKAHYAAAPKVEPNQAEWAKAVQTSSEESGSENYPICVITFDDVWHRYAFPGKGANYSEEEKNTVANYLQYIVSTTGQAVLPANHYGELEAAVREAAETGVTKAGTIEF